MRIIFLTSSFHIGASITLRRILRSPSFEVVGIIHHQVVSPDMKNVRKILKMIRHAGVSFMVKIGFVNIVQKIGISLSRIFRAPHRRKLFDVHELAHTYGVPIFSTSNVNCSESVAFVKDLAPDILVSCYLLQIVRSDMLSIPREGAINVHPALLPKFPGSWTNFWILYHGEQEGGVTVHYMNEHIDAGGIILQKHFSLRGKALSLQCFTKKTADFAAEALLKALHLLKRKKAHPQKNHRARYLFSLPRKTEAERFGKTFRFVRFRKFLQWF
ncbi:hypothetical protein IPN35_03490 [Candidatus Peregrinibacteria bacterium]|nr:MAG: hypothetical protein IPN35_03490 [Candidatus Peregrinibacteria bacterium]